MPVERNLEVLNIAVHKVEKEQYTKETKIILSDYILAIDEYSKLFLNEFIDIYQNPRKTSKSFAQFDKDELEDGRFEDLLGKYMDSTYGFLEASKRIAKRFAVKLESESLATGGYVFCIDYKNETRQNFAVIILNQKVHPVILEDGGRFKLSASFMLETNSINMAANVKIRDWQDGADSSYLSYIRGKKQLTEYFKKFIGCTTAQPSTIATNNVINAVYGYIDYAFEDITERSERKEKAKDAMYHIMSGNLEHVSFETVRNFVFQDEAEREKFMDYISVNQFEISEEFSPNGTVLKKLQRFEYKSRGIELKIRNDVFQDNSRVEFDEQNNLVIKDPEIRNLFNMQN